jgi:hypothetical protein
VPDVTCEFLNVGLLSLLLAWQLHPVHGVHKGLVVSPQPERPTLQKEPKVLDDLETRH